MDPKEFGQLLKKIRKNKGITLVDLGKKIGLTQAYLSLIENGHKGIPRQDTLQKIAKGLDYSYPELSKLAGHLEEQKKYDWLMDSNTDGYTVPITLNIPAKIITKDSNGVSITRVARNEEEIKSWIFDLHHLLSLQVNLFYRGNKLTEEQKKKVDTLLKTILD